MTTKSAKKSETVKFVTPFGIARFPKLDKPDTDGKMADGKFKTGLLLDEGDVAAFREVVKAAAAQLWPGEPFGELNVPLKELTNKDQDTGEKKPIGWGIPAAKSKRRPLVLDAKKNPIADNKIGGGSIIRIGGAFAPYERAVDEVVVENGVRTKIKGVEKGLTAYLNSVQVMVLHVGGGVSDGSEFEPVEGYEYVNEAPETTDDATEL